MIDCFPSDNVPYFQWVKAPTPAPSTDRLEFHGATITSSWITGTDGTADECLQESRGGRNVDWWVYGSVYSRLAGYEDTND